MLAECFRSHEGTVKLAENSPREEVALTRNLYCASLSRIASMHKVQAGPNI